MKIQMKISIDENFPIYNISPTSILLLFGDKGVWWEAVDGQQLQWGSLGCVQEDGVSPKPDEEREHREVLTLCRAMEDAESVRERVGKEG